MDELLKEIEALSLADAANTGFTIAEFFVALLLSATLSMVISFVYRSTHNSVSYSQSFVVSIVIMSITVSFIMLIIGSNLARAFSLVGALSIVRYRNAIKDTQDISYIFMALAVGMACGTRLYELAVAFTIFSSLLMVSLEKVGFGSIGPNSLVLEVKNPNAETAIDFAAQNLPTIAGQPELVSIETFGLETVSIYRFRLKRKGAENVLIQSLNDSFPNAQFRIVNDTTL